MMNVDDIIEVMENQQATIRDQNETMRLFAAYLVIAADKGALDQDCHVVIEAKKVLNPSKESCLSVADHEELRMTHQDTPPLDGVSQ